MLGILMLAAISSSLVTSLAMPVLPVFPAEFGIPTGTATWIVFANTLGGVIFTPVFGRLGDIFGPRRTLVAAMAALTLGSFICALAPNFTVMIIGRVLQGMANSSVPLSISIARRILPADRIGGASSLLSATVGIGSGIGITVGGVLLAFVGWQLVFGLVGILSLTAGLLVLLRIPADAATRGGRIDVWGSIGFSVLMVCLLVPISEASRLGLGHPLVWGLALIGVAVAVVWVRSQLRGSDPMINLRTARVGWVAVGYVLNFVVGLAMILSLLTSVLQVQAPTDLPYGIGQSTLVAGLSLLGGNLAMLLAPRPTAWACRRFAMRPVLAVGLLINALGFTHRILFHGHLVEVIIGYTVVQFGQAILMSALALLLVRHSAAHETASAQAVGTMSRLVGMCVSSSAYAALAAVGSVAIAGESYPTEQTLVLVWAALTTAFAVAAVLTLTLRRGGARPATA